MPTFDVFLSHSSVDKPWVIQLKDALQRYGVSVWLDRDEIRPGDLFVKTLEAGLEQSRAVALIVSPEAIASGWVEEEYARAVSLAQNKQRALRLIPVLLRDATVPGFLQSRHRVDCRDERAYAQKVWELAWGITGRKPPEILDLTAPAIPPAGSGQPAAHIEPVASLPQSAVPASSGLGARTGSIRAGGSIKAENIVTGVQVHGTDAATARVLVELAQHIASGSVEAVQNIVATNLVTGLQYVGQDGTEPRREQFQQELHALREQLAKAIAAGEITAAYDAEDAQRALDRALEQAQAPAPVAEHITTQLNRAATIINRAATVAESAGKFQAAVIKLAPIVTVLQRLASLLF